MDFNILLLRLGMNSEDFVNKLNVFDYDDGTFIYTVEQRQDIHVCPHCGSDEARVKDHDTVQINATESDYRREVVRIRKVRFMCMSCGRTYTPEIRGIDRYHKTTSMVRRMVRAEFGKNITFSEIAKRYSLAKSTVLAMFDDAYPRIQGKPLPRALCMDEIKFSEDADSKYCCILYDFDRKCICDMLRNRQMPYLKEYFSSMPPKELSSVRYFITDMYDAYASVRRMYLPNAMHIVDLFHVITQLTNAVNRLRVAAMNRIDPEDPRHRFMKSHWEQFIRRRKAISDSFYTMKSTGETWHYDDIVFECIKSDMGLLTGWNCMQDLLNYRRDVGFEEALRFVEHVYSRLLDSGNEVLESVGRTYRKWRVEIANSFARNREGVHYTNSIAENINNHLKTIVKFSYGCVNFDRFRRRAMVIDATREKE